jgi:GTP cyclohydrolase I
MENKRRKIINVKDFELAKPGYSNGISLQLQDLISKGEHRSLNDKEKQKIIKKAAKAYEHFLEALGVDWINDPNTMETPMRVAKKYVNDMWAGRYNIPSDIASFPSDGYNGIILEKNIPLISMCSHHHENILGLVHVAYIPGEDGKVVGLSKLNRIVEHFGRRGQIQEALTINIHNAIDKICENNIGVFVCIQATHECVSCRSIKHQGSSMVTSHVSGVFADHTKTAKQEVLEYIKLK